MKKLLAIVLAAIMILSLVACSAAKSSTEEKPQAETTAPAEEASSKVTEEAEDSDLDGEFKLGVMLPFTGSISVSAEDGKNACEMACDYINANGGFNGKKVVPIYYDTQQSAEEAVKYNNSLSDKNSQLGAMYKNNKSINYAIGTKASDFLVSLDY